MKFDPLAISPHPAPLPRPALRRMLRTVRHLYHLSRSTAYRETVLPMLPEVGRFDPGHDAVMMGYDFHLEDGQPKLIEVNTNAGGSMYAYMASLPEADRNQCPPDGAFPQRVLNTFRQDWQAFAGNRPLRQLLVIDEKPEDQQLFPEMACLAELLRQAQVKVAICDPGDIETRDGGLTFAGEPVDMIYNRHCDFYLETAAMSAIHNAYLSGEVCLSPNPFAYGLLADKRRMLLWRDRNLLRNSGLGELAVRSLQAVILDNQLFADADPEQLWAHRKSLVFKPVNRFGGKGVLMGKSMSRKRFSELIPEQTLVQELAHPMSIATDQGSYKTDYRLFAFRDQIFGIAARLYQGQLTNLRTPGGGFARVEIIP